MPTNIASTTDQPSKPKTKLRWYQYTLRSLLIFTLLVALACSWFAVKIKQSRDQEITRETLANLGCSMAFECVYDPTLGWTPTEEVSGPKWLNDLMGYDFCNDITAVWIDQALMYVRGITQSENPNQFSDDALVYLERLPNLRILSITYSNISDKGLAHIEKLSQLKSLDLGGNPITDAGLIHLEGLLQLENLNFSTSKFDR